MNKEEAHFTEKGDVLITCPVDEREEERIYNRIQEMKREKGLDLEATLSYVLLYGVVASLIVTTIGVLYFFAEYRTLNISRLVHVANFAAFVSDSFTAAFSGHLTAYTIISVGVVILMLTPYIRVLSSWIYFLIKEKDVKYTLITLWVLVILTISLYLR